ncbi:MAG: sulfotransferase [Streptosporangiaceae bacterium]|nr:sulfotransferase [Streptosporangiaceae bacterium]
MAADPVFVLCNGRSGSTLLRFLLDAHPDLACPPETNLPTLCAQLATVWSLIEGAPLSANRGDEPPEVPEAAIAGVRATMDRMVGSYLARRGKKRYCDKSLGTARFAPLLTRVYPEARFVCVYRHPMDVIASGAEACPWGLNGYGFDPYIAATPGNVVTALASFWTDNTQVTLAAEEQLADKCFRLRYEDLVADPEAAAAGVFQFLGVAAAPGVSQRCFSAERERFGPADYKIWYTSEVSAGSVGRGWSVPAGLIAPQLLAVMNELAGKLGYRPVDEEWGTSEPPADLRVAVPAALRETGGGAVDGAAVNGPAVTDGDMIVADRQGTSVASAAAGAAPGMPVSRTAARRAEDGAAAAAVSGTPRTRRLGEQLRAGLAAARDRESARRWGAHGSETFVVVAVTQDAARRAEYWRVDLGSATVTLTTRHAQEESDWDIIGSAAAWDQVLDRTVNLSVALRSCDLRYCDNNQTTPLAADTRMAVIGELLGLTAWQ